MAVDREALARALREARENSGMSQEAAAKRLGLSRTVLAQIELGNRPVSSDELSKLATLYDRLGLRITTYHDLATPLTPSSRVSVWQLRRGYAWDSARNPRSAMCPSCSGHRALA